MVHSILVQALAEYGAATGFLASAQRRAEGLVAFAGEHGVVILAVAAGGLIVWSLIGRRVR